MPVLEMTAAVVVAPVEWTGPRLQAVRVLVEEVAARSGVRWPLAHRRPPAGVPAVVLAQVPDGPGAEGYHLCAHDTEGGAAEVTLYAADPRGVLFAVGGLLRHLHMAPGRVWLPAALDVETAPCYPLRGHQLGYRPKNNTYDAWSPEQWERYIRELALFGGNTIELLPPRTDDADTNPLMCLPKEEMLARVTATLERYGLGAGLWYPLMAADYGEPATVEAELAAAGGVLDLCARCDHVFVPGGDPGHTPPGPLLAFLERLADVVRTRHPGAEMWLSGQGFRPPQLQELFALLRRDRPQWLTGLVYGPWTACTLPEMREALPEGFALRLYPDIAHTIHCQFPVAGWDPACMATLGREPINPLPLTQARIFGRQAPGTRGFVTYSEGVNDDVNKFVWTALGWDPDADVGIVLRQYARLLAAPRHADALAQALFALERNWEGPLATNPQVPITLQQLQGIERASSSEELGNWRLQAALYRGYYDAHVRRRLMAAVAREERAREWVGRAAEVGVDAAIRQAREAAEVGRSTAPAGEDANRLAADVRRCPAPAGEDANRLAAEAAEAAEAAAPEQDAAPAWRARIHQLADQLFAGIGLQLSVARHRASGEERGANLEALDAPLGEGAWLAATLEGIAALPTEGERAQALAELERAHSPGPGGFLDDLGNTTHPGAQPHLVGGPLPPHDPAFLHSVLMVPTPSLRAGAPPQPRLWQTAAETLYGVPLMLSYPHLDPRARYQVRVLYHGRYRAAVTLEAGEGLPLHGPVRPTDPPSPVTFPVPAEATAGGSLTLTWRLQDGRGIQVAAVWLLREGEAAGGGGT